MNFTGNKLSENKRPFGLQDISEIISVSNIQLSPGNSHCIYQAGKTDSIKNCTNDSIFLVNLENKQERFITEGTSPCWSPDGLEIAYEAENGDIWIYNLSANNKRFLTTVYTSSYFMGHMAEKRFSWSPDGKYIAYLSTMPYAENSDETGREVREINRLLYKTKGGRGRSFFTDDHNTHIWIIPVLNGSPQLITTGAYNEHSISWSCDSRNIAFISNRSQEPDNNQCYDLWTVNIATKEVIRLTEDFGTVFMPKYSPVDKTVAFLATTDKITTSDSPSADTHLYILPEGSSSPVCLTRLIDRRIENISWLNSGESIYFTAGNEGKTAVYRVSCNTRIIETVIDEKCHILEYSLNADGNEILYVSTDIKKPPEVFLLRLEPNSTVQITGLNNSLLEKREVQDAEPFWFKSFDGTGVQGWIMKPAFFDASKKFPLILVIHGGPHNMFGYDFEERLQLLSSGGYAVLFINPRGSSGYGQSFSRGCVMNWGGGDYKDLMAGLDHVIEKYLWIDKENLGVTGQSYGGFMTNWIITQTNRFKAAVVDGGISNLISFAGTSLYHSLIESEFNGNAYDNYSLLWQWSPLRNVKNVTTPTLFLHGEKDNEVPVSQAEEMFVALKKLGVKTSFVQYPGEGHGWRPDLKPGNKIDLYTRMLNWFDKILKEFEA